MDAVKSRREQYAAQTRQAVLDAAEAAFAERGFTATSITDIAEAARVTKGAVYHHFPDKRALFEAVLNRCDETAQRNVFDAVAKHPDDLWGGVLAALDATLDACADPVIGRLIYLEGPIALGWTRWRECEDEYTYGNIRRLLDSAIQAGIYRRDIPVDAMAQVMTGMITHAGVALAEAPPRKRKNLRRDLHKAIQHLLEAVRSSPQ
ncbi:TetR/AcrR family transcriptional regulator [Mycobacterium sp.]|uniref:TetR/AcrR family transcriptional regulator n=1 Tax=Mycobacterium sp. TaxID=1785 RepID=UPI0025D5FD18|nr:TetR/AcrR family transcriptional regulator [Mycobacterium sp.]MBW0012654.1 TetR/AcrR family transcriptional regulator [Mycobacterium sp.]